MSSRVPAHHLVGRAVVDVRGLPLGSVRDVLLDAESATPAWLLVGDRGTVAHGVPLALAWQTRTMLTLAVLAADVEAAPTVPLHSHVGPRTDLKLVAYWSGLVDLQHLRPGRDSPED